MKGPSPKLSGAPWDLPIADAPLAFVDLEMTGLGADDRVIEVCIERVVGERVVGRLATLVCPADPGSPAGVGPARFGNVHIHGISEAELADAPRFGDVA